jgi:hypothetical protein
MLPDEAEHPTTGWEPELAPEDSLVRQAVLAHVSWAHALANAGRGTTIDRPGWGGGFTGIPSPMLNWVLIKQPTGDWPALVEDIRQLLPTGSPALVISPFPAPDPTHFGLGLVGHPPLMLRPTATVISEPSTDLDVRRVTSPTELAQAERVLIEGYPLPELADLPGGDFYRPDFAAYASQVFVAYDGGHPVATSVAHSAAGVTVVENVAVLERARGRGAGAAITWAATTAWPQQPAVLIASDEGQRVYERLGYLRVVRWTCWLCR